MIKIFLRNKVKIILGLLITIYIILFSYLSIRRFLTLNSHYYDLGIMNQVVYNTLKGRVLEMTDQQLKKNINRMAVHFDPILAVFAPLYLIYKGPETLLVSQTIIVALGALAVFLIANKVLKKPWLGLFFSATYLLYFPVERANLFDFHAVVLATTFFLFAIYFMIAKKKFWFFAFILLSLFTKEHVGLIVAFLGIYIFFVRKDKKLGLATFITGLIFFIATVYFIIPYYRQQSHFAIKYFGDFGNNPSSILINLVRQPLVTFKHFFRVDTFIYLFKLFLPMFYSLFSPLTILIAIPELAINILSTNGNMRAEYFHYNAIIVPFIIYSLILGYKFFDDKVKSKIVKRIVFIGFIITNLISIYFYSPLPLPFLKDPLYLRPQKNGKLKTIANWDAILKDDTLRVASTPILAPYFTEREYFYNFLFDPAYSTMGYTDEDVIATSKDTYKLAEYVIIDKTEIGDVAGRGTLPVKFYQGLRNDRTYKMIYSNNHSIEVYKKI